MFDERNYLIINSDEINKIDFNQVLETSIDTLRYSINGNKTFIKWDGEAPSFIVDFNYTEGPYSHEEIFQVLFTAEWTSLEEEI